MALHERTEKILVNTGNSRFAIIGNINRFRRQQRRCAIHLHPILKEKIMKNDTSKSTILVITIGFLILYLLFSWQWALIVSLIVGLLGIVSNTLSRKIEWIWMKIAKILSYIIPSILLAIIFYFILFPLSLISKLFTKDPLMLSERHNSYFIDIEKSLDKKSMEQIW